MGLVVNAPIAPVTFTRVCTDGSSSSTGKDTGSFDKSLYRMFSMQDDMKTLNTPARTRSEFDLYLEYAIKKTNSDPYDSSFDNLDSYLGSLGLTNEIC